MKKFVHLRRGMYEVFGPDGTRYEMERRRRNPADQTWDTGWYLYGCAFFGEWLAHTLPAARAEVRRLIDGEG